MWRWMKRLFGNYDTEYEYWVRLSDINISPQFAVTRIGRDKYKSKWKFYRKHGYCESKIILNKDFLLTDGYSSYKIYRAAEGLDAKVPVYFE